MYEQSYNKYVLINKYIKNSAHIVLEYSSSTHIGKLARFVKDQIKYDFLANKVASNQITFFK